MTVVDPALLANRRGALLAVAAECFAQKGFRATTMQQIARAAGMSVGNLYNYFSGKDDIVSELADRELRQMAERVESFVNSRISAEQKRTLLERYIKERMSEERARVWLEIMVEAIHNEGLACVVKRFDEAMRAVLREAYRLERVQANRIEQLIAVDMAMMEGAVLRAIVQNELDADAFAREMTGRMLREAGDSDQTA